MSEFDAIGEVSDEAFEAALVDDAQTDVPVADEPAPSSESVEDAPETPEETDGEAAKADEKPEAPKDEPETPETPAALNWETAPEKFRQEYEARKQQLADAQANSLREKFFDDPEAFLEELNGLSTSQFQQTTQQIVQKGIDAMPDEFADYLAKVKPESIAKALAQIAPEKLADALDLGMPPDKVRKIINQVKSQDLEGYLNDNDNEEAPKVEKPKAEKTAKPFTPEDIDRIVAEKVAEAGKPQKIEQLKTQTFTEIMEPVERLIEEAGLKPLPTDTPEDKEYKERVYQMITRDVFDHLHEDPKNKARADKMYGMFEVLDAPGVKHLTASAKLIAEDYAGKLVEMFTNQRVKAKSKGTEAKKKEPPKVVPTGGVAAFGNAPASVGNVGQFSESDFEAAGM